MSSSSAYLGIDFGTSGARAIAIDAQPQILAQAGVPFSASSAHSAEVWQSALFDLLRQMPEAVRRCLRSIALNGTSSTVLIGDEQGVPLAPPLLYNDDRGAALLPLIQTIAPPHHTVVSATSSLAKLLWLQQSYPHTPTPTYFLHQADWLAFLLHGRLGISDYHNALKLGYDVEALRYPDWLLKFKMSWRLPEVVAPGTAVAPVQSAIAAEFGLPVDCVVCAGTTDSIAAFLASGAQAPGEAVTSLGSTLVLKLLSQTRIEDARYGIYSHRLGDLWLVGGASNTGGAVLRQFFSDAELQDLSRQVQPDRPTGLEYYPLLKPGERFPINDPQLLPRLTPRPENATEFLQGLLEGIARIEAGGYRLLQDLGATPLTQVYTAGGGANNPVWTKIRSRLLGVPVQRSIQTEAAYGSALLAMQGSRS